MMAVFMFHNVIGNANIEIKRIQYAQIGMIFDTIENTQKDRRASWRQMRRHDRRWELIEGEAMSFPSLPPLPTLPSPLQLKLESQKIRTEKFFRSQPSESRPING